MPTRQTLLLVVAVTLGAYLLGTCGGRESAHNDELERNAYKLALSVRPLREAHVVEMRQADNARTAVGRAEEGVSVADQSLGRALDSARITVANQSATNADLRAHLTLIIPQVDSFRALVKVYADSVNLAMQAHLRERYAAQALITQLDSTVTAYKTLAQSRQCKMLGVTCPKRTTVALVSGGIGLILGLFLLP